MGKKHTRPNTRLSELLTLLRLSLGNRLCSRLNTVLFSQTGAANVILDQKNFFFQRLFIAMVKKKKKEEMYSIRTCTSSDTFWLLGDWGCNFSTVMEKNDWTTLVFFNTVFILMPGTIKVTFVWTNTVLQLECGQETSLDLHDDMTLTHVPGEYN